MNNNIQTVKEIIQMVLKELETVQKSFINNDKGLESTKNRIERWHERTLHKLSAYLADPELSKFNNISQSNFRNKGDRTYEIQSAVRNYKNYFVELGDDLDSFPHKVVKDIPDEFASSFIAVFISYAWANDNVVLAIDQWLRNKGIKTKIDKRDFFAGSRIRDEIMRVMSECKVILLFHSQQSKDKPWIEFEHELAADIEMSSKIDKKETPRIIYIVIDDTPLPNISARNRIAVMAKGKRFDLVCEEIYHNILQLPKASPDIDLDKWQNYSF